MAYATQSDLVPLRLTEAELVQLTDDDKSGKVNDATVASALEEASGVVDSYCRGRYVTPLQQSDMVKARTLDIALYLLFKRRRNAKLSETIRQAYEDSIVFLKDIAAGRASLDQPGTVQTPQASGGNPVFPDKKYAFDDKNTEGFC